ncbi:MAG: thymidine phosphorylase, partial [Candidatus Woesearchaeota archaeon]
DKMFKIVNDIVHNKITTIELTYFISACYTKGLTTKETVALTRAMINTGSILRLKRYPVLDKHCIGGVPGNRTTMIVVPILVAAGLTVPKTSSRSITSPAGTADTMEVLAKVDIDLYKVKRIIEKVGGCMVWGGAINLSPADDKIIRVENPLSIDAEGNMLSSILAKKGSVSSTHVLVDIPVGKGAKIFHRREAERIGRQFEKVGREIGMKIKILITDGSQPIGNGIGPALEARDVLYVLMNDKRAPSDLREKSLFIAEEMLEMAGKNKKIAREMLESGAAYKKMCQIIKAQGGPKITNPENIKIGNYRFDYKSNKVGKISHIDNISISKIARIAGAPQDKGAGIYLYKHRNESVKKGEKIFTIYTENKEKMAFALEVLKQSDKVVVID